tara:strand:- start:125 stop:310 length:186 start_codon:yes stop_codon:yes gene_type:complete
MKNVLNALHENHDLKMVKKWRNLATKKCSVRLGLQNSPFPLQKIPSFSELIHERTIKTRDF